MATYRYRPHRRMTPGQQAAAVGIGAVLVLGAAGTSSASTHHRQRHASASGNSTVAQAIAYARRQLGKPYCWSGTGPSCYDCSGLAQMAYRSAGVAIPRTSELQWADLPHDSRPHRGDLVFAPGSDGSWASPGHVALVIGGGRVIQAYSTGVPIEVSSLGQFAAGSGGIIGYARPSGGHR